MFDAAIVPLKALFGTFILLAVFVVLFILLIGTFQLPEPKFLLIPVVFSVGVALIRSIRIINEIIKEKEDDLTERNIQVFLQTCPEYWIKDTVNLVNTDTNDTTRVNICKNYSTDENGKIQFVGGSGGKFANNFKKPDGNNFDPDSTSEEKVEKVIEELNSSGLFEEIPEGFQQPDYLHSHDDNRITRGNPNDLEDDRLVTFLDTGSNLNPEAPLNTIDGKHVHYKGNAILHSNTDDVHVGINGREWHVHDSHHTSSDNFRSGDSYSSNWMNLSQNTGHHGVEINLDRLNEAQNICDLSKNFFWTEARNKCNTKINP